MSDDVETFRFIRTTRLEFFGHIARADPSMYHSRVLRYPVLPPYRGTGTADQADLVKLGSGQLNPISLRSTLVRKLLCHRAQDVGRSLERQRPLDKPHDDDDDDVARRCGCSNQTPLHLVASSGSSGRGGGHPEIIRALLASGARVNQPDSGQQTPVHKAALAGSRDDVQALLEGGADPNHVDNMGHSPVHVAVKRTYNSKFTPPVRRPSCRVSGGVN